MVFVNKVMRIVKENPLASASFWRLCILPKAAVGSSSYRKCFQCFTHFWVFSPLEYLKLLQEWLSAPSLFTALGMLLVFLTGRAVDPEDCVLRRSASPWAVLRKAGAQSFPWAALGVVQLASWRVDENSSDHSQVSACLWFEAADLYLIVSSWGSLLPSTTWKSWQFEVRVCVKNMC